MKKTKERSGRPWHKCLVLIRFFPLILSGCNLKPATAPRLNVTPPYLLAANAGPAFTVKSRREYPAYGALLLLTLEKYDSVKRIAADILNFPIDEKHSDGTFPVHASHGID